MKQKAKYTLKKPISFVHINTLFASALKNSICCTKEKKKKKTLIVFPSKKSRKSKKPVKTLNPSFLCDSWFPFSC